MWHCLFVISCLNMLYIAADHGGFQLKQYLLKYFKNQLKVEAEDLGAFSSDPADDLPDFAVPLAKRVLKNKENKGILICRNGHGMCIAANKVKGIRAVCCSEPYSAKLAREHNDANILCFGARVIGSELAKMIVDAWLDAEFEGGRHQHRIDLIREIEKHK